MPITLKKDEWKVKDPSSGNYRGTAILSTTLPEDAAQIIEDTQNALDAEEVRAGQIIDDAQNAVDGIEGQSTIILESIAKAIQDGNNYELIDTAVESWLDAHPEATTTVQDGSLTLQKFKDGELPFVTPEQFGAKGNGVADDTQALQAAFYNNIDTVVLSHSYKISEAIYVNKPTTIISLNGEITQTTFSKGAFRFTSSNINIIGTLYLISNGTLIDDGEEHTDDSAIRFLSNNQLENFTFDTVYIKGFKGGVTNNTPRVTNLYIKSLKLENVVMGIWGANWYNTEISNIAFKNIVNLEARNPAHVVYLTGNDNTIRTKNFLIGSIYGSGCKAQTNDAVLSIKSTSNFICRSMQLSDVNIVATTLYSSGFIGKINADSVHVNCYHIQGFCADGNPFTIDQSYISNIDIDTGSLTEYFIRNTGWLKLNKCSFTGQATACVYLSGGGMIEDYKTTYKNTGNSTIPVYVINTPSGKGEVVEPTIENCTIVQYIQNNTQLKFVLNPELYDPDVVDCDIKNVRIVDNNVWRTMANINNQRVASNLIVTTATVQRLLGSGLYTVVNGGGIPIIPMSSMHLKDGATQYNGDAWTAKIFRVIDGVSYEV